MADMLTAVRTVSLRPVETPQIVSKPASLNARSSPRVTTVSNADHALLIIKSNPSRDDLLGALYFLVSADHAFDVSCPSPIAARIINELVSRILPDFGLEDEKVANLLTECLKTIVGLKAVIAKAQFLISQPRTSSESVAARLLLQLLMRVTNGDEFVMHVLKQTNDAAMPAPMRDLLNKELVGLIASGKIVSVTAQLQDGISDSKHAFACWIASGGDYVAWLARNLQSTLSALSLSEQHGWKTAIAIYTRAMTMGYAAQFSQALFMSVLDKNKDMKNSLSRLAHLGHQLKGRDQTLFVEQTIRFCAKRFCLPDLSLDSSSHAHLEKAATLFAAIVDHSATLHTALANWAADPTRNCIEPIAARRMVLSIMSNDSSHLEKVLNANMQIFSSSLFIDHAPAIEQEACAQTILLAAGHINRSAPKIVLVLARSSLHTSGTSKRLDASSSQARFLGMIVAMALSELVGDKSPMDFKVDEVRTPSALAYLGLVRKDNKIPLLNDLDLLASEPISPEKSVILEAKIPKQSRAGPVVPRQAAPLAGTSRVIELMGDDDLVPYPKPDDDLEDDDEDPTMVNRDRPRAPVYIRDLIKGLQNTESYDIHHLALTNAATLIRRKSTHGKEVLDHVMELQAVLTGLGDTFDIPDFSRFLLQALIALLLADPQRLAPSYARLVFEADLSLGQRAMLLSAMGLAARELAGQGGDDDLNPITADTAFPSKRLTGRLHEIYAPKDSHVQTISRRLEDKLLKPIAQQIANAATGPEVLKVRKISSRLDVEKKRRKVIPNALAKTMFEQFFSPLIGHWMANVRAYGQSHNAHLEPFLLSTFLKTLAIMLHASGPGTMSLPQMTTEYWDLLLGVRTHALKSVSVMEAVMFGLLTMLEVNEDKRRIAEEHARQLLETQEWVNMIYERLDNGSEDDESQRVRMLATGVVMQLTEVIQNHQRLLAGDLFGY